MLKLIAATFAVLFLLASVQAAIASESGDIMMAGYLLWRIRTPASGYTLEQRVDIIQARVNNLLTLGAFDPGMIRIVPQGNDVSIYADQDLIITIDQNTARANKTTPAGLASVWAERLRVIYPLAAPIPPQEVQQAPAG